MGLSDKGGNGLGLRGGGVGLSDKRAVESPIYSIRRFIKKRKVRTCRNSPK